MQITLKLKGFARIVSFLVVVVSLVAFGGYKVYRYISYRNVLLHNQAKQKQNLTFNVKVLATDTTLRGYLLTSSLSPWQGKSYSSLIIMNLQGHTLLQQQMPGIIYDFRQWTISNKRYYSYGINNTMDSVMNVTASSGHIVILDSALNEIKQVHFIPTDNSTVKGQDLDIHDFIMLSPDRFITVASVLKTVSNIPVYLSPNPKCKVLAPVIQEVDNGTVVWQWDASKYPEFYANSNSGNNFYDTAVPQDYMHFNSLTLDPRDSSLILSFLNLNQVIKINRHTGDIVWRLGGKNSDFPLQKEQYFIKQHHATLTDSFHTLLLLDNGDKEMRSYSRILEFRLDEAFKSIESFKAWKIPEIIAGSRGSVEKENGDYLICGGIANYLLIADSKTGRKKLELKANQNFYRAYLVNDISAINTRKDKSAH